MSVRLLSISLSVQTGTYHCALEGFMYYAGESGNPAPQRNRVLGRSTGANTATVYKASLADGKMVAQANIPSAHVRLTVLVVNMLLISPCPAFTAGEWVGLVQLGRLLRHLL